MGKKELVEEILQLQQQVFSYMVQRPPDVWLDLWLTIDQLKSLLFINFKEITNFKSLAAALGVTPPNVTGIIDRLVAQDMVIREVNPEDRRESLLKTTEKGKELVAGLQENHMYQASSILMQLSTDELDALFKGLSAVTRLFTESQKAITNK